MSLLFFLGYRAGQVLGWGRDGSLFTGGVVAISSTMIIARALSAPEESSGRRCAVFSTRLLRPFYRARGAQRQVLRARARA
mgnify:FL=1